MFRSLKPSHSAVGRLTRQALPSRRTLITPTAVRQADLVQDLYIRELKNYKPTPMKLTDSEGHVQKFAVPKPPPSPEEGNIANELKAYEDQTVEVEGQAPAGQEAVEEDWFEDDEDEEEHAKH